MIRGLIGGLSENHVLRKSPKSYVDDFVVAALEVYDRAKLERILQAKFCIPNESNYSQAENVVRQQVCLPINLIQSPHKLQRIRPAGFNEGIEEVKQAVDGSCVLNFGPMVCKNCFDEFNNFLHCQRV